MDATRTLTGKDKTMESFSIVEEEGRTYSRDPENAAYQYMVRLAINGRTWSLKVHEGAIRVESFGLMAMTFCPVAV